ncbi:TATA-box factor binding protein, putative [Perkinsus marinus ATCC 50983]|uniref:TATA-box factor binding protein, putative n=1 Tax=Perkinsus marinus (strain ATCC 50983 / TXsc) TaxID=423536 RepID=C5KGY5_PERM5|nr:TATA-box factor binding protein, putative [Perkinsus marinus ATCC 50983]EER15847.1 TATA-box factor binding protein, putative [Perkinsus marinus ATCC 50983]|eukprot:XP_002784051.1 TATA-box factor binding protein, putative [Perkinsus marinus ATCC 50983]
MAETMNAMAVVNPLLEGSPTDSGLGVSTEDIFCQNVLAHANLNTTFELTQIVKGFRNAEYDPSKFPCVRIRYWRPQCTIAVFRSGKIQATGAASPEDARLAMHRTAARLKARMNCERVKFSDFTCDNILATYDLGSTMNLLGLSRAPAFANVVAYEPSRYPAVVLRDPGRGVTVDVFSTGRVSMKGKTSIENLCDALNEMLPHILDYRCESLL